MPAGLLTAFQPQPVVELKKQDKSKIETILAYGLLAYALKILMECEC